MIKKTSMRPWNKNCITVGQLTSSPQNYMELSSLQSSTWTRDTGKSFYTWRAGSICAWLLDIGRFQWKWLPMGIIVNSDVFQKKLDSIYIGLPGVTGIADDMIVYGKSEMEHDKNLIWFLEVMWKNSLWLNKDKLQFKRREVSFFGHCWSMDGISPVPKKIESILQMLFQEDKETMHSF